MERNLDIDSFERLLKDRSDEFKMYPEKRVWHSIYNNIHPGRKWPSVAMSITLIGILLLTGYLNTDTKSTGRQLVSQQQTVTKEPDRNASFYTPLLEINQFDNQPAISFADNSTSNISGKIQYDYRKIEQPSTSTESTGNFQQQLTKPIMTSGLATNSIADNLTIGDRTVSLSKIELPEIKPINNGPDFTITSNKPAVPSHSTLMASLDKTDDNTRHQRIDDVTAQKNIITEDNSDAATGNTTIKSNKLLSAETTTSVKNESLILSDEEKAWIENYAMYNRPAPKKWAGKLGWQMYFTPSVVYRQLKNTISDGSDVNQDVAQHPSYGMEIGSGFTYPLLKGLKIRTGLQLNFTRYNSDAFTNSHPVATTITLVSSESHQPYPSYRSTAYSNIDGISAVKLHNETFQISMPVGMDLKIAGNENLQWNIGATIQPTYLVGGKSYLLSTDKRNYIKETSLLNRWNVNAGFETFVSYKIDKGIIFQFGPQFRKQLFTTNSKQYIIQEKLNNYGFKFGITKLLK